MGRDVTVSGNNSFGIGLDSGVGTVSADHVLAILGGRVGINSTDPNQALYVDGNVNITGTFYGDGSGLTGIGGANSSGGWTDDGATVRLTDSSDYVGIGTASPQARVGVRQSNWRK